MYTIPNYNGMINLKFNIAVAPKFLGFLTTIKTINPLSIRENASGVFKAQYIENYNFVKTAHIALQKK